MNQFQSVRGFNDVLPADMPLWRRVYDAARETDIGLTGGGAGKHMVYLSGVTDHHVSDAAMLDHIVALVEAKAAEIEAGVTQAQAAE